MSDKVQRLPHAGFEQVGRLEKAEKIAALVGRRLSLLGADVLEVGCGSGYMSADFARRVGPDGSVQAVDRVDQRRTTEGFQFRPVEGTALPFDEQQFDLVLSNHVMEHVGELEDQAHHLAEIQRVLRPGGWAYVSVPNRWRIVEPHYHLPLLSWLPENAASRYLELVGKGEWYDVVPPSHATMRRLLDASGMDWEDVTWESLEVMEHVESMSHLEALTVRLPAPVLRAGWWFVPSMMYLTRRVG